MKEAERYRVLPIDDRSLERLDPSVAGRPDLMAGRKSLTVYEGMTGMAENAFINVKCGRRRGRRGDQRQHGIQGPREQVHRQDRQGVHRGQVSRVESGPGTSVRPFFVVTAAIELGAGLLEMGI
jgi:hypothetical protein